MLNIIKSILVVSLFSLFAITVSAQRDSDQVCIICDPLIVFENGSDSRAMIADCEDEQDQDTPNNLDFTPILTNDGYVIVPYRVHFMAFEKIADINSDGELGALLADSKFNDPDYCTVGMYPPGDVTLNLDAVKDGVKLGDKLDEEDRQILADRTKRSKENAEARECGHSVYGHVNAADLPGKRWQCCCC